MKYNDSGMLGEMKGVVIDIINELSRKLNFTYTMHIIPVTYSRANESDLQMYNVSYPGCPHLVEKVPSVLIIMLSLSRERRILPCPR